jgi:hypothetical protein
MLARPLDAGGKAQDARLVEALGRRDRDHLRLALGQGAGLVDHERVDLLHALERLGVLDQHAGLGAAADADHDRHRGGEPERAGAGDDQHAHRGDQAMREARLGAEHRPGDERNDGDGDDQRDEPAGHLIGQPLDRRARALRRRHHLHDAGEQRVAADLGGAHHERAGLVERAGDHLVARLLGHRHGFAGHHRLVDGRAAVGDLAVDRHLLARTHAQQIADLDRIERDLLVAAVRADAAGGLRRQVEQGADGAGSRGARAQFEHLAEQDQHGDDSGGLEIDCDRAAMAAQRRWEDAGRQGRDRAVEIGDAGAHRDQGEHVEIAGDQRLPAAHEERPARPQHDRRGEGELQPVRQGLIDPAVRAGEMRAHFQHHHRHGEREPDPEPARHVGKLGIGAGVGGGELRLERHAADRAGAGTGLADLRMHRAGVDGALGHRWGRACVFAEVLAGVGGELGAAAGGAEIVGAAVMHVAVRRSVRIDRHAADRVARAFGRLILRVRV